MEITGVVLCFLSCTALFASVLLPHFPMRSLPDSYQLSLTFFLTFVTDDITLHYEVYFYSMFYVVISPSHDLLFNVPSAPALTPIARVFNVRGDFFQLSLTFLYLSVTSWPLVRNTSATELHTGDDTISNTVAILHYRSIS